MNEPTQEKPDVPVWARPDAFPAAPSGWGWVDPKGNRHPCDSFESLAAAVKADPDASVDLIWTPRDPHMVLPEEMEEMSSQLLHARKRWNKEDLDHTAYRLRWFAVILGGFSAYIFLGVLLSRKIPESVTFAERLGVALRSVFFSIEVGLAFLMFMIFAFIPWYQARKRSKDLKHWSKEGALANVPALRFETWLSQQKAPFTKALLILISLVALAQMYSEVRTAGLGALFSLFRPWDGIEAAGMVKSAYFAGEKWRLLTAPFLHGNILHFLMNASALLYLGKRLEVFARWPHLPMVFLFAAAVGGEASARLVSTPSVGASGGLMGWLGFLLVFETLHHSLVPSKSRRRLLAGVALTALIGVVGYRYIDNAAHAGGLIAGMLYALIVFPPSSSTHRPKSTKADLVAGIVSITILLLGAGMALLKIMA